MFFTNGEQKILLCIFFPGRRILVTCVYSPGEFSLFSVCIINLEFPFSFVEVVQRCLSVEIFFFFFFNIRLWRLLKIYTSFVNHSRCVLTHFSAKSSCNTVSSINIPSPEFLIKNVCFRLHFVFVSR